MILAYLRGRFLCLIGLIVDQSFLIDWSWIWPPPPVSGNKSNNHQDFSGSETVEYLKLFYLNLPCLYCLYKNKENNLYHRLIHSQSEIRSEVLLKPALLCHKDTARDTQSPLLGAFLAFHFFYGIRVASMHGVIFYAIMTQRKRNALVWVFGCLGSIKHQQARATC